MNSRRGKSRRAIRRSESLVPRSQPHRTDGTSRDDHVERRTARRPRTLDRGRPPPPPRRQARARGRRAEPRPRPQGRSTPRSRIEPGDVLEVVTLVGGGAPDPTEAPPLAIGPHRFRSRLLVGTGKYTTLELMRDCLRRQRLRGRHRRRPPRAAVRPRGAEPARLPRPGPLHDPAQHRRLLQRRGRPADRPARPRTALGPEQPGCRLGEARGPGRHPDPPARPGRDPARRPRSWSPRGSTSSATPATTRSWPAASRPPGPPA